MVFFTLLTLIEPRSVRSAFHSPHWYAAMKEELFALHHNDTWDLVPRDPEMNVVGSKWVFKTKQKAVALRQD
jgi:hypothetical protein